VIGSVAVGAVVQAGADLASEFRGAFDRLHTDVQRLATIYFRWQRSDVGQCAGMSPVLPAVGNATRVDELARLPS